MKVVRLPQTYIDLVEIAAYLGQDDPSVADRFYDSYEQTLNAIKRTPKIGSIRDTRFHGRTRMWFVKHFEKVIVFYTESADEIVIIRLLHAARDYTSLM
jgi:toxin ParE1/3/4